VSKPDPAIWALWVIAAAGLTGLIVFGHAVAVLVALVL
jgi:hypothetical protein